MLFVCFSSLDREKIVKPILYHLFEFGIDIWYDHKKLFISDKISFDIYEKGIKESSDILIIYSPNLIHNSKCGLAELQIIYKHSKDKTIYPVLYNSDINDYSEQHLKLLEDTIFYKVTPTNTYQVAVQIAIKLLSRIIKKYTKDNITTESPMFLFNKNIGLVYNSIPPYNNREKAVLLMQLITTQTLSPTLSKITELNISALKDYFFSLIKLNATITENDIKLLELLSILIIHC